MSQFNFDSEFFRKIISKSEKGEKICSLPRLLKKAMDLFYDEYDYYPDLGVFAPGTFTIMGDHLEYVNGNLVQGALPMGSVIVGKSLYSVKCKLFTSSPHVEGIKKSVFPLSHYKKKVRVFPEWMNYIKGIINNFPNQDLRGFDAVIHSNVPFRQSYGSSAALQVSLFTFLEAADGVKACKKKELKGNLCYLSEMKLPMCEKKLGQHSNFTSAVASANNVVRIDCRTKKLSSFSLRDINIIFLLIFPNFAIESNDRDYIDRRKIELFLAARLLGLTEIIDATEYHLNVLSNMEDPSKEEVLKILEESEFDKEFITNFVEELFDFPRLGSISDDYVYEEDYDDANKEVVGEDIQKPNSCFRAEATENEKAKPPVSYIHKRIAELCAGKIDSHCSFPEKICEEINCLGGIENLSVASDITLCGKLLRRVRHIVTENLRSLALDNLTSQLDYTEFGSKLIQSHLSLKLDYEVSCPTLDSLIQLAIDTERVYGAKMTSGGGTLTLLHRSVVEKYIEKVVEKFGEDFQFYLVFPSSGAKILNMGVKRNTVSTLSKVLSNRDQLIKKAIENFEAIYKYRPTHGAYSNSVIHLIGDFTDHSHGFCLSLATNLTYIVVGALNGTSKVRTFTTANAENESQKVIFSLLNEEKVQPRKFNWRSLIKSVIANYQGLLKGFDSLVESNLPLKSGASSVSSLVMALYTFLEVTDDNEKIPLAEKAHRCLLAMQESCSTFNGISKLLVGAKSKENFAMLVDTRTLGITYIPFQDPSVTLLITFAEGEGKINQSLIFSRMADCNRVAKALGAKTLRCATLEDLDGLKYSGKNVPEESLRRAKHVITENERVLKAAEALKNNDFETLGELMVASHVSLRDDYEICNFELDRLVILAMEVDGVLGSKAPICGFDNCIISLVKRWATDDLIEYLITNTSTKLTNCILNSSGCCNSVDLKEYLSELPSPQYIFEQIFPL